MQTHATLVSARDFHMNEDRELDEMYKHLSNFCKTFQLCLSSLVLDVCVL